MRIPGYTLEKVLVHDDRHSLCRGRRERDLAPVLVRVPREAPPRPEHLRLLEHEFEIMRGARLPGVVRSSELVRYDDTCCLVFEDSGATPLSAVAPSRALPLDKLLPLAVHLCKILAELHKRELIHGNINPQNILVGPSTDEVLLTDFRFTCRMAGQGPDSPNALHGPPQYIAPEQTGRMDRVRDYRSDFYSLGITLYELITGSLPFQSDDLLELVHWHIARKPVEPADILPGIPAQFSQIVMKLLAKQPEDRYQSAWGVENDIENCAQQWRSHGAIAAFPLARRDVSDRFTIERKFYGRENQIQSLLTAFGRASEGPGSMVLIAGNSGVGKTSLVKDLYRPALRRKGYFVSGKFDQVSQDTPYSGWIQACRMLVRQMLSESEDRQAAWKARLAGALGSNAAVLNEVIPELSLILGAQSAPAPVGSQEAQNRFQLALRNLLEAAGQKERPLVVFLDDLQWADPTSLGLLSKLVTASEMGFMLLIAAYRDNEAGGNPALVRALEELNTTGSRTLRMELEPLGLEDITIFLRDALAGERGELDSLALLVMRKTQGNPFFVIQFLYTLRQQGLLEFDYQRVLWKVRFHDMIDAELTDDVVDLMTQKIRRLSTNAQRTLTLAACLGGRFERTSVSIISRQSSEQITGDLAEAAAAGLVSLSVGNLDSTAILLDEFKHDRVQQAAYSLIPASEMPGLRLQIGRDLFANLKEEQLSERLFDVLGHFNAGARLIGGPSERTLVAGLNLRGAEKARRAGAFPAARTYSSEGLSVLPADSWRADYPLTFSLHRELAECEHLCGNRERAEQLLDAALAGAQSDFDKADLLGLRIVFATDAADLARAVEIGIRALNLLGIDFPASADLWNQAAAQGMEALRLRLTDVLVEDLSGAAIAAAPNVVAAFKVLACMVAPAYHVNPDLFALLGVRAVELALAHGHSEASAYGISAYAMALVIQLEDYDLADRFAQLAVRLVERFHSVQSQAKVYNSIGWVVDFWRHPLKSAIEYLHEGSLAALEQGDLQYAGFNRLLRDMHRFYRGENLDELAQAVTETSEFLEKTGNGLALGTVRAFQVLIQNLRSPLTGPDPGSGMVGFGANFWFVGQLRMGFLFRQYTAALDAGRRHEAIEASAVGTFLVSEYCFYHALTLAATLDSSRVPRGRAGWERLMEDGRKMAHWADGCPGNFLHKHLLISAEIARLSGKHEAALSLYERAISSANSEGAVHVEAIASELAADFCESRGDRALASSHLRRARDCYAGWGSQRKVEDLEAQHPDLLGRREAPSPVSLDMLTAAKAAQAIAQEMVLDDLLRKLIQIAIENAGAQRGLLILNNQGKLSLEAEGTIDAQAFRLQMKSVPLESSSALPHTVIQYVRKTGETLVVGDAQLDERFSADPYLSSAKRLAILCMPMVHKQKLEGILYLENELSAQAFAEQRIGIMRLLCSQAAISLENARLYGEMKLEVSLRRKAEEDLRGALADVEDLKNRLHAENVYLQEEIRHDHNFEEIVGGSKSLINVLRQVERVAPTDATVLIYGETGTGKELIARAVHSRSSRRDRPLVKLNCGAISVGLVESELFGHVKGAFTGAIERRTGRFELANGGTLFLDEVGELPLDTQVRLLRAVQEQEFEPVGSSRTVKVDVRIIAATNRDLSEAVAAGRFRSDLYYRLNVLLQLKVPRLHERPDDIPQLVMFFVSRFAKKFGRDVHTVSRSTMDLLLAYPWPGNVRELQNVIERAVVLCQDPILTLDRNLLPVAAGDSVPYQLAAAAAVGGLRPATLEETERRHIVSVLQQTGGVVEGPKGAARILNLHPNTLRSRMKKLSIPRAGSEIS